jgi:hypothetical protein
MLGINAVGTVPSYQSIAGTGQLSPDQSTSFGSFLPTQATAVSGQSSASASNITSSGGLSSGMLVALFAQQGNASGRGPTGIDQPAGTADGASGPTGIDQPAGTTSGASGPTGIDQPATTASGATASTLPITADPGLPASTGTLPNSSSAAPPQSAAPGADPTSVNYNPEFDPLAGTPSLATSESGMSTTLQPLMSAVAALQTFTTNDIQALIQEQNPVATS